MTKPFRPILGPTAIHLKPVLTVTEQNGFWLKGKLVADPSISVELSFEQVARSLCFPSSPYTYILFMRGKQTLFEFELGHVIKSTPEASEHVYNLISRIRGHLHIPVTDRPPDYIIEERKQHYMMRSTK